MTEVSSASDDRTANNTNAMRHNYRVLNDDEKAQMVAIKDMGEAFAIKLHEIGGTDPAGEKFASAHLMLAFRHIEDAVYRAVKHITK